MNDRYECVACGQLVSWKVFRMTGYCINCQGVNDILTYGEEKAKRFNEYRKPYGFKESVMREKMKLPYWRKKIEEH